MYEERKKPCWQEVRKECDPEVLIHILADITTSYSSKIKCLTRMWRH